MSKIKKQKNPYCNCPIFVIESSVSGGESMIIIHEKECSWPEDVGYVRLSVFDVKGQLIKTERVW